MISFLAGFVLGVLLTLRITVAVVRRARRESQLESYQLGYKDCLEKGSTDSPRSGADDPAPT